MDAPRNPKKEHNPRVLSPPGLIQRGVLAHKEFSWLPHQRKARRLLSDANSL